MTLWPARRVGDRILCGKRYALTGEYDCQGPIATVEGEEMGARIIPPAGLTEDPPGFLRPTARAKRKGDPTRIRPRYGSAKQGQIVAAYGVPLRPGQPPDLPWRRACPHCKCVNEVTAALL